MLINESANYDRYSETLSEKLEKCKVFMNELFDELNQSFKDYHPIMETSPFCPNSGYICREEEKNMNSWNSKPKDSFRCSDHWNWYANLNKCEDEHYIQCYTKDAIWTRPRYEKCKEHGTKPRMSAMVGYFGSDNMFHCIYGEKFNRNTKTWTWCESDPKEIVNCLKNGNLSETIFLNECKKED